MTERDALGEYARTGSPAAFEVIVRSYVDLVYASARRRVRDPHVAEDVAQLVFLMLSRKAKDLPADRPLAGWLFRATRFAAAQTMRAARRRARHERLAAELAARVHASRETAGGDVAAELEDDLEEALSRLNAAEREAILLRYFKGLSLEETGAATDVSAAAAAQRVSRGLRKLRAFFARRGIIVAGESELGGAIAAAAMTPAPAALSPAILHWATSSVTPAAVAVADHALRSMAAAKAAAAGGVLFGVAVLVAVSALAVTRLKAQRVAAPAAAAMPAGVVSSVELRKSWDPSWDASHVMAGWPVALPGNVTGTPTPADVDGDGKLDLLVPCTYGPDRDPVVHPSPRVERLLFAFHADGTPVPGWPAVISDERTRRAQIASGDRILEGWMTTPSVMDWDHDGRDEVVILDRAGTVVVEHEDGRPVVVRLSDEGDGLGTAPLVDVNGDGVVDLIMGHVLTTVYGKPVKGWPESRRFGGGFAPAVGDANGDGKVELYEPFFTERGHVGGFDSTGRPLPGWPQKVQGQCLYAPVLGDVDGDGKLEVIATHGNYLSVWRWDGTPGKGTTSVGALHGILKQGMVSGPLALADLDGDGADEIVLFDRDDLSVKAWHGDGRGLTSPDGVVVKLPDARCAGGVTVGDLGGDGVQDLFVATYWVRLAKDGTTTVTNMLPGPTTSPTATQCTITDLDGDGLADVLFGLADGRVFVYRSGERYDARPMAWPTPGGGVRHTGTRTTKP